MKHLRIYEYYGGLVNNDTNAATNQYEQDFKNELIRLTLKYSHKIPTQVMIDWLETNLEIMKNKAEKEKTINR